MAQYEFNPAEINPEAIRDLMRQVGGTNLAGQSMAGPVATGQAYAQQIAGGMPMEQVIAPGVSYSPEQPSGYTQADLNMIARGPAPVMPKPPTTGEVATIEDQMPYAPPGVKEPTPYVPGGTGFTGIPNFFANLDFSNLPDFSNLNLFGFNKKTLNDLSKDISEEKLNDIIKDIDSGNAENNIPFSGMNFTSVPDIPNIPSIPTNFTPPSVPNMPNIPSVPNMPSVPNIPSIPMNFTPPNVPASNFVQPSVEEIVSPLSRGRTLPPTPRGLFSL